MLKAAGSPEGLLYLHTMIKQVISQEFAFDRECPVFHLNSFGPGGIKLGKEGGGGQCLI